MPRTSQSLRRRCASVPAGSGPPALPQAAKERYQAIQQKENSLSWGFSFLRSVQPGPNAMARCAIRLCRARAFFSCLGLGLLLQCRLPQENLQREQFFRRQVMCSRSSSAPLKARMAEELSERAVLILEVCFAQVRSQASAPDRALNGVTSHAGLCAVFQTL